MKSLEYLVRNNVQFATWRLPDKDNTVFIQQEENNTNSKEFIIAPFTNIANQSIFKISQFEEQLSIEISSLPKQTSKKEYLNSVNKAIESIKAKKNKKIVISRVEIYSRQGKTLDQLFSKMESIYPHAFVFCYHHKHLGTWMGASPEQLIKQDGETFYTMALAGTKFQSDNSPWAKKEITEHQIVIDDIISRLELLQGENITLKKTKTIQTGKVKHLQTEISFNNKLQAIEIAQQLHPTPAVCGTPTQSALNFILSTEKHNRNCYTGYVGLVDEEKQKANLFVNLRSMQITKENFILYLGGGITYDSDPEAEWEETKNKAKTMLSVIENC